MNTEKVRAMSLPSPRKIKDTIHAILKFKSCPLDDTFPYIISRITGFGFHVFLFPD